MKANQVLFNYIGEDDRAGTSREETMIHQHDASHIPVCVCICFVAVCICVYLFVCVCWSAHLAI